MWFVAKLLCFFCLFYYFFKLNWFCLCSSGGAEQCWATGCRRLCRAGRGGGGRHRGKRGQDLVWPHDDRGCTCFFVFGLLCDCDLVHLGWIKQDEGLVLQVEFVEDEIVFPLMYNAAQDDEDYRDDDLVL